MIKLILPLLFSLSLYAEPSFDPDVEIKINGLVCSSCAIGVKKGLDKTKLVKKVKFNTKKQLCRVEYIKNPPPVKARGNIYKLLEISNYLVSRVIPPVW